MSPIQPVRTLEEIPARGLKLLGAISHNPYIRATLARRGYTDTTHEHGWSLVLQASGYRKPGAESLERPEAAAAIVELDAWDEPNFRTGKKDKEQGESGGEK